MNEEKIVVLIPTLNPNKKFLKLLKELRESYENLDIIVVNDGSTKEHEYIFYESAKKYNVKVLHHKINKGKGVSLKTGLSYYLKTYNKGTSKGIVTADSDGQHLVEDIIEIGKLLNKLEGKKLILGVRNFKDKIVPLRSKVGNNITSFIFKILYNKRITDTQTGLRGITYDYIKDIINIDGNRFEYEINVLCNTVKQNIEIKEHKIKTIYFDNNKNTYFTLINDSFKIYKSIFKNLIK